MNDDFNTPVALSVLFQLSHEINKTNSAELAFTLKHLASILGLCKRPQSLFTSRLAEAEKETIENLIQERLHSKRRA